VLQKSHIPVIFGKNSQKQYAYNILAAKYIWQLKWLFNCQLIVPGKFYMGGEPSE